MTDFSLPLPFLRPCAGQPGRRQRRITQTLVGDPLSDVQAADDSQGEFCVALGDSTHGACASPQGRPRLWFLALCSWVLSVHGHLATQCPQQGSVLVALQRRREGIARVGLGSWSLTWCVVASVGLNDEGDPGWPRAGVGCLSPLLFVTGLERAFHGWRPSPRSAPPGRDSAGGTGQF